MTEPLRELLAQFTVEVDPDGALDKGNAAVDALKKKLAGLERELARIRAPAAAAGQALARAFAPVASSLGAAGLRLGAGAGGGGAPPLLGGGGSPFLLGPGGGAGGALATRGGALATTGRGGLGGFGVSDDLLAAARARFKLGEQGAAGFAQSLRDKLAPALAHVRAGFNSGGGGGDGPGLLDTLTSARTALLGLGAGAAVAGIRRLVGGIGDIADTSARLGVTNAEVQRLGVLAKLSGSNVGALGTAFRTLATNATSGSEESAEAFRELGVETKNADGTFRSRQDLFFETAGALADVRDETERAALAQKLFGRSALELAPLLAKGRGAIEAQRKELEKLPVLSDKTIAAAEALGDEWDMLGPKILKAAEPLIEMLIPALAKLTEWSVKALDSVGKWLKQTDFLAVGLTALAAVLSMRVIPGLQLMIGLGGGASRVFLTMAGSLGKFALTLAKTMGPLLILEDFIVFLRGGKSVIGAGLDKVFGEGTQKGTLKALNDMIEGFKDLWKWILGDGQGEKVKGLYKELAEGIAVIFHDMLVKLGVRNAEEGIDGMRKFDAGEEGTGLSFGAKLLGGLDNSGRGWADPTGRTKKALDARFGWKQIPAPGSSAAPDGASAGGKVTNVGDIINHVTVNGYSAQDSARIGADMEMALSRQNDSLIAGIP